MGDNGKCAPEGQTPCDPEAKPTGEVVTDPPAEGCEEKVCPGAEKAAEPVGAEA